jgi:hypothetical protein
LPTPAGQACGVGKTAPPAASNAENTSSMMTPARTGPNCPLETVAVRPSGGTVISYRADVQKPSAAQQSCPSLIVTR